MKTLTKILFLSLFLSPPVFCQQQSGWTPFGGSGIMDKENTVAILNVGGGLTLRNMGLAENFDPYASMFTVWWKKIFSFSKTIPSAISCEFFLEDSNNFDSLEIFITLEDSTGDWYSPGDKLLMLPGTINTYIKYEWKLNSQYLASYKKISFSFQFRNRNSYPIFGVVRMRSLIGIDNTGLYIIDLGIIATDVTIDQTLSSFVLSQNYPNPFNPTTKIKFTIPVEGFVNLKVFDPSGQEIKTLVSEEKSAGTYETSFDASNLPSGIYFYRLQAGNFMEIKKMILLK